MSSRRLLTPLLASIREANPAPSEILFSPLAMLATPGEDLQQDAIYLREAYESRSPETQVDRVLADLLRAAGEVLAASGRPPSQDRDVAYVRAWTTLLQVGIEALSTPETAALLADVHPPSEPFLPFAGDLAPKEAVPPALHRRHSAEPPQEAPDFEELPRNVLVLRTNNPYGPQAGASLLLTTMRVQDLGTGTITDILIPVMPPHPNPDAQW